MTMRSAPGAVLMAVLVCSVPAATPAAAQGTFLHRAPPETPPASAPADPGAAATAPLPPPATPSAPPAARSPAPSDAGSAALAAPPRTGGSFINRSDPGAPAAPAPAVAPAPLPQPAVPPAAFAAPAPSAASDIAGIIAGYSADGWPVVAGKTMHLSGVFPVPSNMRKGFAGWLKSLGNSLSCAPVSDDAFRCLTPQGVDIAQGAILNGAARATVDAPALYHDTEDQARAARRGIWH